MGYALHSWTIERDKRVDLFCQRTVTEKMACSTKVSFSFLANSCDENQCSARADVCRIQRSIHCKQSRQPTTIIADSRSQQSIAKALYFCLSSRRKNCVEMSRKNNRWSVSRSVPHANQIADIVEVNIAQAELFKTAHHEFGARALLKRRSRNFTN